MVEYDLPPAALFLPCGWKMPEDPDQPDNPNEKHKLKHYRKFYAENLEKV